MRVLIIVNPRSGSGSPGLYDFIRELGEARAEVTLRFLAEDAPLAHLLRDFAEFDRVVAAGGDGTVASVAYATRGSRVPVVAYPAGTANVAAMNLGLPGDPKGLAEVALHGRTVAVDLGELAFSRDGAEERVGFELIAGAGFDATIMQAAAELKPILGVGAYFAGVMRNLQPKIARFRVEADGQVHEHEATAVLVANFTRLQFDLPMTHAGDAQDGLLEVVVLRARHVGEMIPLLWAAMLDRIGDHPDRSPGMDVFRAREVRVTSDQPMPLQYDGETLDACTPFSARVLPGVGTFVVPEGYEGLR